MIEKEKLQSTNIGGLVSAIWKLAENMKASVSSFIGLTDAPESYVGEAEKFVKVTTGEDGLEFIAGASGSEVTAGTDDEKAVTPKALADADLNSRLESKIIAASRAMTAASGNVAYTGIGFKPSSILSFGSINASLVFYMGASDSLKSGRRVAQYAANTLYSDAHIVALTPSIGNDQFAVVNSYDNDGFTLTWTKVGSPTGTATIAFLCFK